MDSGDALKEKIIGLWVGETEPKGDVWGCRGAAEKNVPFRRGTSGTQSEQTQNPHWAELGCGSSGAAGQCSDLCPASVWELLSGFLGHCQEDGIGDEELGEGFKPGFEHFFG